MRNGVLGRVAAAGLLLAGLVLAISAGFEAKFPDEWPFLLIGGMGLSFFVRYGSRPGIGKAGLVAVGMAGVGILTAYVVRWLA